MIASAGEIEPFKSSLLNPITPADDKRVIEALMYYDLPVSVTELWPHLIDTSKMNQDLGLPPRQEKEVNGETLVTTKTLGRQEEWIERPWFWVHEKEVQQGRDFITGWMTSQRGVFKVEELGPKKSRIYVYFRWGFKSLLNYLIYKNVPKLLDGMFKKFFETRAAKIDKERNEKTETDIHILKGVDAYTTIKNYCINANPLDLDRIHVKELASKFNLELNDAIKACIRMMKDGEMSLSWDVICPHCRGARSEQKSISGLKEYGKCEPCGTTFGTDQEESVEVVFHVTPKLRAIQKVVFCAAEPAKKKHIKLYQGLAPGAAKNYNMHLPEGIYRLRKKNSQDAVYLVLSDFSQKKNFSWNGSGESRVKLSTTFELRLTNTGSERDYFTLEEAWWFNDRLLSGEALSNPYIREIFSEDHLQTGLKLNVGNQVILFTDIVGSTPFYKASGDAIALKLVQAHYKEVSELITKFDGVVVKYIGDAIMAAFLDLEKAMACTVAIHQLFNETRSDTPIRLRASFHEGKVLCANMNVGLDYFGNTVNQAAKIQKHAESFEIAVLEDEWQRLKSKFHSVKEGKLVEDAKLGVKVRVLSVR